MPFFCWSYKIPDKEATVTVLAVSVVTATPLKLNPPFSVILMYLHTYFLTLSAKLNWGWSPQMMGFPFSSGKVLIVSRTLSGMFLAGAVVGRVSERGKGLFSRKSPKKSGQSQKNRENLKRDNKGQIGTDESGTPPV